MDLNKETRNPFLESRIRIWIFLKTRTLNNEFYDAVYCLFSKML